MDLLTYIQHDQNKINPVSLEALQGSQQIASQSGGSVKAITFNPEINPASFVACL